MNTSNTESENANPIWNRVKNLKWEKIIIWAAFLALVYFLRHLFFIVFFTFVFCYVIRSAVVAVRKLLFPGKEGLWLDRGVTLGLLGTAAIALIAAAALVFPIVTSEFKVLSAKVQETKPEDVENAILQGTVGNYLFTKKYGNPADQRFKEALAKWKADGRQGEGLYKTFPALNARLKHEFEAQYDATFVHHLQRDFDAPREAHQFDTWFLQVKAPELFAKRTDYYSSVWQAKHGKLGSAKAPADDEKDNQIRELILKDVRSDPVTLAELRKEWEQYAIAAKLATFRESKQYQLDFKEFYQNRRRENEAAVPYDYELFEKLRSAYGQSQKAFLKVVNEHRDTTSESPAHLEHDFEVATKQQLAQDWWKSSSAASSIREHIQKDGPMILEKVGDWLRDLFNSFSGVPIQLVTSFILALLILLDMEDLKKGVHSIRNTRLRPIYDEIVPGITTLGKLLGKSFRGQAIIALFNAAFMLLAMFILGIENKFLFAGLVFVFSFVPVIGVVLSGIPIILAAIMQPGGSTTLAVYVIVAIVLAHIIEGTLLGPKIVGKLGHMHPVLVIGILTVAEHFFGMWGLLLGVPVAIYIIRVVLLGQGIPGITDSENDPAPATVHPSH